MVWVALIFVVAILGYSALASGVIGPVDSEPLQRGDWLDFVPSVLLVAFWILDFYVKPNGAAWNVLIAVLGVVALAGVVALRARAFVKWRRARRSMAAR